MDQVSEPSVNGANVLVPLNAEQISQYWDVIAPAVEASLDGITKMTHMGLNNILKLLLSGEMTCWTVVERTQPIGFILTYIQIDPFTELRSLLIYSLCLFEVAGRGAWRKGLTELIGIARATGCTKVIAYTMNDMIVKLAESIGINADVRYLTVEC